MYGAWAIIPLAFHYYQLAILSCKACLFLYQTYCLNVIVLICWYWYVMKAFRTLMQSLPFFVADICHCTDLLILVMSWRPLSLLVIWCEAPEVPIHVFFVNKWNVFHSIVDNIPSSVGFLTFFEAKSSFLFLSLFLLSEVSEHRKKSSSSYRAFLEYSFFFSLIFLW